MIFCFLSICLDVAMEGGECMLFSHVVMENGRLMNVVLSVIDINGSLILDIKWA